MSKILLVEDNDLNRDMLSRRLERKGYQVVSAGDGNEGVAKARSASPDLILMDMNMPVLDGWEATRRLKADPALRAIPVIALTAHAMVGDREKTLSAGCDDYEMKPVDLAGLLVKVQTWLTKDQAGPAKQGFELLVVDDNELNSDMLSRRLQKQDYRVTVVTSGAEALDCIRKQAFDLVLLDVMMPEMNGFEVLQIIRASYSIIELPVIMVTAKDQSDDMVSALQRGANDYLTKPLNFPVVLARIETQLKLKQAHLSVKTAKAAEPQRPVLAAATGPNARVVAAAAAPAGSGRRNAEKPTVVAAAVSPSALAVAAPLPKGVDRVPPFAAEPSRADRREERDRRTPSGAQRDTWVDGPPPGNRMILGGYEVLEELGRGGMGVVYKARHERMNRIVALKVIDKHHLAHPDAIRRFYREIQAAAQLSHPNIVLAYDAGQCGDTHYFAMEYVEGTDLGTVVKQSGALPVSEACNYIRQAARGLHHAFERNLVHRDIKPSNLLITWNAPPTNPPAGGRGAMPQFTPPAPGRATVKILDLGLALLHQPTELSEAAAGLTRDGRVVGTADYMAPEQWMNAHKVDVRADLYSLGCTFYYLLTGEVPFPSLEPMEKMLKHHLDEPEPLERLRSSVPSSVVAVVRRLMAKKPEQRFQQPAEVAEALK